MRIAKRKQVKINTNIQGAREIYQELKQIQKALSDTEDSEVKKQLLKNYNVKEKEFVKKLNNEFRNAIRIGKRIPYNNKANLKKQ